MGPIERVIEAMGGVAKTAKAVGVSHVSVIRWRKSGRLPAERVRAVADATGIAKHDLRPDLFDAPKDGEAAASATPRPSIGDAA